MRSLVALALVAFAAACGTPATPSAAGSAPLVVPKVPRRAADGSARPTPPAAPEGLRAVLRVADVEQLAREVSTLAGAPGLTPTGILEMIVGDDVARAIDPTASVDALAIGV